MARAVRSLTQDKVTGWKGACFKERGPEVFSEEVPFELKLKR